MPTLDTVIEQLQANQQRLGIELNPPATEAKIRRLEQALGRVLPRDIAAFYRYCNGFETDDALFKLNSLDWILEFSSRMMELRFELADYMISSDVWEVVLDPTGPDAYRIVNANHGSDAEVTLTTSLWHFISRYLDGEDHTDLYTWYEEAKAARP